MPVPTEEEKKQWRERWGSEDNPDDVERIRKIVKIMQKTRDDEKAAGNELIEFLKDPKEGLELEPIKEKTSALVEILVPDLRGLRLDFLPEEERDLKEIQIEYWHLESADLSEAHLESADLSEAHLESADLWHAHLESAYLSEAHLESANLTRTHLESAYLGRAHLESAYLSWAHLESADLSFAHLQSTNLSSAHLESARLVRAHLEGANFNYAKLYREDLKPAEDIDEKFKDNKQLIQKSLAVDFKEATFKPRFRHQLYRFRPNKYRYMFEPRRLKLPKYVSGFPFNTLKPLKFKRIKLPIFFGKLRITSFISVSTEGVVWSGNRMLERYIKDQQFTYEFKENHPVLYFFWNLTSKCGQSVPRLAFLILSVIFGFALIFHNYNVVNLLERDKLPGFWAPLYTSVNIFSNLGMGIKEPASKIGAVLIMVETMLGFVALGLLLTVAGSRFARRS